MNYKNYKRSEARTFYLLFLLVFTLSFTSAEIFGYGKTETSDSTSTTFYPNSTLAITGTPTETNVTYIKYDYDDLVINVSEQSGSPALDYRINFTGVSSFNDVLLRSAYLESTTNHEVLFQIYNYETLTWDNHYELLDSLTLSGTVPIYITDSTDHVSNGIVQVRFYHPDNGNVNDKMSIDSIQLLKGTTSITTNEHDSLSGRNSESNHPWAYPRTNPFGFYNVTTLPAFTLPENASFNQLNASELNINYSLYLPAPSSASVVITDGGFSGGDFDGGYCYQVRVRAYEDLGNGIVVYGDYAESVEECSGYDTDFLDVTYSSVIGADGYLIEIKTANLYQWTHASETEYDIFVESTSSPHTLVPNDQYASDPKEFINLYSSVKFNTGNLIINQTKLDIINGLTEFRNNDVTFNNSNILLVNASISTENGNIDFASEGTTAEFSSNSYGADRVMQISGKSYGLNIEMLNNNASSSTAMSPLRVASTDSRPTSTTATYTQVLDFLGTSSHGITLTSGTQSPFMRGSNGYVSYQGILNSSGTGVISSLEVGAEVSSKHVGAIYGNNTTVNVVGQKSSCETFQAGGNDGNRYCIGQEITTRANTNGNQSFSIGLKFSNLGVARDNWFIYSDSNFSNWMGQDNAKICFGNDKCSDMSLGWDGTNGVINVSTGSLNIINNTGYAQINARDFNVMSPESKNSKLSEMKDPSLIKREGKTEEEFHSLFPEQVINYNEVADTNNCHQVLEKTLYCYDFLIENKLAKIKSEPEERCFEFKVENQKEQHLSNEQIVPVYNTECSSKNISSISLGDGWMLHEEYIFELKQEIESLKLQIEELKKK